MNKMFGVNEYRFLEEEWFWDSGCSGKLYVSVLVFGNFEFVVFCLGRLGFLLEKFYLFLI